ncbi:lysosomal protective protein-like [Anneissia japonica]|uniref:lysosomal protective protein-like n=1 Tax=Anneissia japonica TaxID=1529436 RepID=UPI0014256D8D|nr:lysosomal protective protein-like [Anneissia japonica]
MKNLALCCFIISGMIMVSMAATNPDEVLNLPGLLKQPSFPHYSGYLKATGTKQLHYWLITSTHKITDPLVVFIYGGPGCSSLYSLFAENGPFTVQSNGVNLDYNEYSWNSFANVLYLESPAGVGFSYSEDKNYKTDDDQITEDHYAALKSFFVKYPALQPLPLYLMGESYASVYVSLLAMKMINAAEGYDASLKGIATGNGFNSVQKNVDSIVPFIYYHGLIGNDMWSVLQEQCCKDSQCSYYNSTNDNCTDTVNGIYQMVTDIGLNTYNLNADCVDSSSMKKYTGRNKYSKKKYAMDITKLWDLSESGNELPCVNTSAITKYLNDPYVRQALHIESTVPAWTVCNSQIHDSYVMKYPDLTDIYKKLLALYEFKLLFYNGDVDLTCNALGNEWFVKDLGKEVSVQWRPWLYNNGYDQIAGFVQEYEDHLAFVTIKGAGHMAPHDNRNAAHQLIFNFMYNRPY